MNHGGDDLSIIYNKIRGFAKKNVISDKTNYFVSIKIFNDYLICFSIFFCC